jgi:hypothetical protein
MHSHIIIADKWCFGFWVHMLSFIEMHLRDILKYKIRLFMRHFLSFYADQKNIVFCETYEHTDC